MLVANYVDRSPDFGRIGTPTAETRLLAFDKTTGNNPQDVFANFEVYRIPLARKCRFLVSEAESTDGLTACRDDDGQIRRVPDTFNPNITHILYEDDVEGIYWEVGAKADLDRVLGIYVLTAPGQTDSDNFTQPALPSQFDGHPFTPPTEFDKGTFLCFSRFVEPRVAGGFIESVAQGANAISVSVPDLPAKTVCTGIIQGLYFGSAKTPTTSSNWTGTSG